MSPRHPMWVTGILSWDVIIQRWVTVNVISHRQSYWDSAGNQITVADGRVRKYICLFFKFLLQHMIVERCVCYLILILWIQGCGFYILFMFKTGTWYFLWQSVWYFVNDILCLKQSAHLSTINNTLCINLCCGISSKMLFSMQKITFAMDFGSKD